MEKVIFYPVFFTATIRSWKNVLKPEKYKIIVLVIFNGWLADGTTTAN